MTTTLRCTTLHYTTLHYTTRHYTTLHDTTLHYILRHYTTLHCISWAYAEPVASAGLTQCSWHAARLLTNSVAYLSGEVLMVVRTVQDFLGSTEQCTRSPAKCIQVIIRGSRIFWGEVSGHGRAPTLKRTTGPRLCFLKNSRTASTLSASPRTRYNRPKSRPEFGT